MPQHIHRAFTLVELMVVIAIVTMLVALLLPSLNQAREAARRVSCASQAKQLAVGVVVYATENADFIPVHTRSTIDGDNGTERWGHVWLNGWTSSNPNFRLVQRGAIAILNDWFIFPGTGNPQSPGTYRFRETGGAGPRQMLRCPSRMHYGPRKLSDLRWFSHTTGQSPYGGWSSYGFPAGGVDIDATGTTHMIRLSRHANTHGLMNDLVVGTEPSGTFGWSTFNNHSDGMLPLGGNASRMDGSVRWLPFESTLTNWRPLGGGTNSVYYPRDTFRMVSGSYHSGTDAASRAYFYEGGSVSGRPLRGRIVAPY